MSTPSNTQYVMNIMHVMHSDIEKGGKVLVHCHAGLGRTGLIIACYLLYSKFSKTPESAIEFVRANRAKSIQTRNQVNYVYLFFDYLVNSRIVYPAEKQSLADAMSRQRNYLSGLEYRQLRNIPKVIFLLCKTFRSYIISEKELKPLELLQSILKQHQQNVTELPDYKEEDKKLMRQFKKLLNTDQWGVLAKFETRPNLLIQLIFDWIDTLQEPLLSPEAIQGMTELYEEAQSTSINVTMISLALKSQAGKVETQILEALARSFHKLCSLALQQDGSNLVKDFCALIMTKCCGQLIRKDHPLSVLFMQTVLES